MTRLFVLGSGQCARHTLDILESTGAHEVVGLLDPFRAPGEDTYGYPILGDYARLGELAERHGTTQGVIAIGDGFVRRRVLAEARASLPEFELVSAVHASAVVSPRAEVGPGCMISPLASIGADCRLGSSCLVGIHAFLSESVQLGDFAMASSGAAIGDHVTVGECAALTLGVTVVDRVSIGAHSVVGAGSLVLRDVPERVVAFGSPARVVRERQPGEPFLRPSP